MLDEVERYARDFLWGDSAERRKIHHVNWDTMTRDKTEMRETNRAILVKLSWRALHQKESLWVRVLSNKYKESEGYGRKSFVWRSIEEGQKVVRKGVRWTVVNGVDVSFWKDVWLLEKPLVDMSRREILTGELHKKVRDYWVIGEGWNMDALEPLLSTQMVSKLLEVHLAQEGSDKDSPVWTPDPRRVFSTRTAYNLECNEEAVPDQKG